MEKLKAFKFIYMLLGGNLSQFRTSKEELREKIEEWVKQCKLGIKDLSFEETINYLTEEYWKCISEFIKIVAPISNLEL